MIYAEFLNNLDQIFTNAFASAFHNNGRAIAERIVGELENAKINLITRANENGIDSYFDELITTANIEIEEINAPYIGLQDVLIVFLENIELHINSYIAQYIENIKNSLRGQHYEEENEETKEVTIDNRENFQNILLEYLQNGHTDREWLQLIPAGDIENLRHLILQKRYVMEKAHSIKDAYISNILKTIDSLIIRFNLEYYGDGISIIRNILINKFCNMHNARSDEDFITQILNEINPDISIEIEQEIAINYNLFQRDVRNLLSSFSYNIQNIPLVGNFIDELVSFIARNPNQEVLDQAVSDLESPLSIDEFYYQIRHYLMMILIDLEITNTFDYRVIDYVNDLLPIIRQEEELNNAIQSIRNLAILMNFFYEDYNPVNGEESINSILAFITDSLDLFQLHEEIYSQIEMYLRRIFIDEDIEFSVSAEIINLITPIIGTIDNPQSILGNLRLIHLARLSFASLEYDDFSCNENQSNTSNTSNTLEVFLEQITHNSALGQVTDWT